MALEEIEVDTVGTEWNFGPAGGIWPGPGRERAPLFGESYLELAAIDLNSIDEIHAFISRWGILGVRWYQDPSTLQRVESPEYQHLFGMLAAGREPLAVVGADEEFVWVERDIAALSAAVIQELQHSVREAEDFDREIYKVAPETDAHGDPVYIEETTAEFVFGATLIRDLVRVMRWQAGEPKPEDWESAVMRDQDRESLDEATWWFKSWATPLLGPFHPQFQILEFYASGIGAAPPFYNEVSLLNVMALELYNHACEDAQYKVCANETCGRLFVRQTGRAVHGQHRTTGVKYCSSECARAQAQRQYRRRRRGAAS